MVSSLELCLAQKYIDEYAAQEDSLSRAHGADEDRAQCERVLQAGIKSFGWIQRTNSAFLEAANAAIDVDPQWPELVEAQYRGWLNLAPPAEQWIAKLEHREQPAELVEQFRRCAREAARIVDRYDRLKAVAQRMPSAEELDQIAIDPRQWLSDPSWTD